MGFPRKDNAWDKIQIVKVFVETPSEYNGTKQVDLVALVKYDGKPTLIVAHVPVDAAGNKVFCTKMAKPNKAGEDLFQVAPFKMLQLNALNLIIGAVANGADIPQDYAKLISDTEAQQASKPSSKGSKASAVSGPEEVFNRAKRAHVAGILSDAELVTATKAYRTALGF